MLQTSIGEEEPPLYIIRCKAGANLINYFKISIYCGPEGIEPSSKRGNHKLSLHAYLCHVKFSCRNRTKAINSCLIL